MKSEIKEEDRIVEFEIDGKKESVYIKDPSLKEHREARKVYNKAFKEALEDGAYLKIQWDEILRERGLWNDKKQAEYSELIKDLNDREKRLVKGGIKLKEARDIAVEMRKIRAKMRLLLLDRIQFDSNSVEGAAEQAQFDHLLVQCILTKKDGKPYFKDVDDYLERGDEEHVLTIAHTFSRVFYGTIGGENQTYENKFLRKWKFTNEEGHLVDEQGRLINVDGKHVDKEGRLIKWEDEEKFIYIDSDGVELTKDGDYVIDSEPFLDDDGNAIED